VSQRKVFWVVAGSSVKQLAQKYFGAPGGDDEERTGDLSNGLDFGVDSTQALHSRAAQVPAALAQVRAWQNHYHAQPSGPLQGTCMCRT